MGTRWSFRCDACSYSAEVSGGADAGERGYVHTAICRTCRPARLVDAIKEHEPFDEVARGVEDYVCPHARTRRHDLALWTAPGPCPRCRGVMVRDGEIEVLWD